MIASSQALQGDGTNMPGQYFPALLCTDFPSGIAAAFFRRESMPNAGKRSTQIVLNVCRMLAICKGDGTGDLNEASGHPQLQRQICVFAINATLDESSGIEECIPPDDER